jgi:hypothetical protein
MSQHDRERLIGWKDDAGIYLLPTVALERIRKLLGQQSITASLQVLYSQFDGMKLIAGRGKDKVTRPIKMWGELYRVLHLLPDVLEPTDELQTIKEEQEAAAVNDDLAAAAAIGL